MLKGYKGFASCLVLFMSIFLSSSMVYGNSINLTDKLGNVGDEVTQVETITQVVTESSNTQDNQSQSSLGEKVDKLKDTDNKFINQFSGIVKSSNQGLSESSIEGVSKVVNVIMFLCRMIFIGIVTLLSLRVGLDLAYLVIPFSRKLLANGHVGNANTGLQNNGIAGGYMSGGNFGGGFGGGMQTGIGGSPQTPNNDAGSRGNKVQLVTTAALNAVAAEGNVDANGTPISKYKVWLNDMLVTVIVVGVGFVAITTGLLTKVTISIGVILSNIIG